MAAGAFMMPEAEETTGVGGPPGEAGRSAAAVTWSVPGARPKVRAVSSTTCPNRAKLRILPLPEPGARGLGIAGAGGRRGGTRLGPFGIMIWPLAHGRLPLVLVTLFAAEFVSGFALLPTPLPRYRLP